MMADERTPNWASLLPRVQLAKNSRYHTGIKTSPFEAMFGRKAGNIQNNTEEDSSAYENPDYSDNVELSEIEYENIQNERRYTVE